MRTPHDLGTLLSPIGKDEFVREYLSRKVLTIGSSPGRFARWLSWANVNELLAFQPFHPKKLRLMKDGKAIEPQLFTKTHQDGTPARLVSASVHSFLRDGAVLVLDGLEETYGPASALARCVERDLLAPVNISLHVGFGSGPFFHQWEEEDAIVAQVIGATKWEILGPANGFPPVERNAQTMSRPHGAPHWTGKLDDGGIHYIPRGWWYANSFDWGPAVFLTVRFSSPNGLSMLNWLRNTLKDHPFFRADVPRFAELAVQGEYLESFRSLVNEALASPDILRQFACASNDQAQPHSSFGLPWAATPEVLPPSGGQVDLLASRGLEAKPSRSGDAIELLSDGTKLRFHPAAEPILRYLNDAAPLSVSEFVTAFQGQVDPGPLREMLVALADNGLISVTDSVSSAGSV